LGRAVRLLAIGGAGIDRAEVDDRAAAACGHHRQDLTGEAEGAAEGDGDLAVPDLVVDGGQLVGHGDGRVVDEYVDAAELREHVGDGPTYVRRAGDVGRPGESTSAPLAELSGGGLGALRVDVEHGHPGALVGQAVCRGSADAGTGAGDDGNAFAEPHTRPFIFRHDISVWGRLPGDGGRGQGRGTTGAQQIRLLRRP